MPALPALVAPLASALAAALAHRSATQRGCGAAARPAGCPFDVPGIAGAACPFVRGSTERKPGLHRLSAGGRWIRTIGTPPNFFGRPSIRAQFTFRNINRLPRDRDRWFEAISLQQGVCCEPDFRGRIPSITVGD